MEAKEATDVANQNTVNEHSASKETTEGGPILRGS
jgi:hypothetical protein